MNLYFRLIRVLLCSQFKTELGMFDECETKFRVSLSDLDVLFHMNNGKYFSLMDLGRTDLMIRGGAFSALRKEGVYPVIASEMMKFKKSLGFLQRFSLKTKVVGWDEKAFYLEQKFCRRDKLHAFAVVKAQFLNKKGERLKPLDVLEIAGEDLNEKDVPSYAIKWNDLLENRFNEVK